MGTPNVFDGRNPWQQDEEVQSAQEPEVPGAIRNRQLVLPRRSARSHPAVTAAASSSRQPLNRSRSFLFNHSSQILTLRRGGEAGMGTRAAEVVVRTSRAW